MPIYEYICPVCGTFEEMQKVSAPPPATCPKGHTGIERKISASGFILKGSGWYATDYARKGGEAKPESGASGDGKPSAEGKPAGNGKAAPDAKAAPEARPAASAKPAASGS